MRLAATFLIFAMIAPPLPAAQGSDPDWPCIQRRVDHLSLAVMWPHPLPEEPAPLPPELAEVAEQMALRRVSVDQIDVLLDGLDESRPAMGVDAYGQLFADAFQKIDTQRTRIISGIVRYARGQAALADQIDDLRAEFTEAESAAEPDFDRLDALEVEIDWRERVFEDRNSALTYVCESPVLLERRAYEIAQRLLARVD